MLYPVHSWLWRGVLRPGKSGAFTLIELLIVVAIVGILAAIAIPNFLQAQVRAKVARAQADMMTIATALEAYCADANDYPPNDGLYNTVPLQLSTPIDYLSRAELIDPFAERLWHPVYGIRAKYYTYGRVVKSAFAPGPPAIELIDSPLFNPGAFLKYGQWRMMSLGPDLLYSGLYHDPILGVFPTYQCDVPYDPTNGTISFGNILRTQRDPLVLNNLSK